MLERLKFKSHNQELAVTSIVAFFVFLQLLIFVTPTLESSYVSWGIPLSSATIYVISLSKILIIFWPLIIGTFLALFLLSWIFFTKLPIGKLIWRKIIHRIPRSKTVREAIVYGTIVIIFGLIWIPIAIPMMSLPQ